MKCRGRGKKTWENTSLEPPDSYHTLVRVWNIMVIILQGLFFKLQ